MARLPDAGDIPLQTPQPDRPIVSYRGGQPQEAAVGADEAVAGLGQTMQQAGATIQDASDRLQRAHAEQDFISKKLDLDQQFAQDTDYATVPQRYRAALTDAMNQSAGSIATASQRADFLGTMSR